MIERIMGSIFGHLQEAYYNRRYKFYRKKYNIPSSFQFNGIDVRIYGEGQITFGDESYIGSYSTIQLSQDCLVHIGRKCMISHNVRMYTSTAVTDQNFTNEDLMTKTGNIIIGDGVWIGANVFINPGIQIGDNAVVGANSVVTKDIPEFAIAAGLPAEIIRLKRLDNN